MTAKLLRLAHEPNATPGLALGARWKLQARQAIGAPWFDVADVIAATGRSEPEPVDVTTFDDARPGGRGQQQAEAFRQGSVIVEFDFSAFDPMVRLPAHLEVVKG